MNIKYTSNKHAKHFQKIYKQQACKTFPKNIQATSMQNISKQQTCKTFQKNIQATSMQNISKKKYTSNKHAKHFQFLTA